MRSNDDDGWIGVLACQSRLCQGKELFQGSDYSCKSVGLGPARGDLMLNPDFRVNWFVWFVLTSGDFAQRTRSLVSCLGLFHSF
jgi:hypothetical protein